VSTSPHPLKVGALCWPQHTAWAPLERAAVEADRLGYDSLWTWDHIATIRGSPGPIFEGWSILSAWAQVTAAATVGLLVGANTLRNPGLVAKLAITLDHVSTGRAVLGLGSAWYEEEHRAHGIEFGDGFRDRIAWLDEAAGLLRELTSGGEASSAGHYRMRGAVARPLPISGRIPILIGGGGERRTLRVVARHADMWNVTGHPDVVRHKLDVLRGHCAAVGRDVDEIERTVGVGTVVVRSRRSDARRVYDQMMAHNGIPLYRRLRNRVARAVRPRRRSMWGYRLIGTPRDVIDGLRSYVDAGFPHLIVSFPAPYDEETMERIATEIRPALERHVARST
jgi:alkanesulfonate monooxygenase SsuD/methylene tetrahydromethanopterin reductase-like flavin-dependent oxidoreductase (luciferase family)